MKQFLSVLFFFCLVQLSAQSRIVPGAGVFDIKKLQGGTYEMAYFSLQGGKQNEVGSFTIETELKGGTFRLVTTLHFINSNDRWIDTSIAESNTFRPLYRSSFSPGKEMVITYGNQITGYYLDKKTKQRTVIQESANEPFFDSYMYPYLLGLLPLQSGYKGDIAVYDYHPGKPSRIKTSRIEEVRSNLYKSAFTDEHKVWQTSVFEESTGENYTYHIDKNNGRIWKIEILAKGQRLLLIDKEIDYRPIKAVFNKEATLKLITSGDATIQGEAFARDNENEGLLKGMAILNIKKRQFAKAGTSVLLIPNTPYFKEWIALNEKLRKQGKSIPLLKEAAECIKTTTVYDDKGNFEFTNLMPGEYLLYTEFGYVHTTTRTEVVGYTDTYINGMFQGSSENTETYQYGTNAVASIKKQVSIKKSGEKVSVKLKKTL